MPEKGRLAMTTLLSDVKWVRVLLAGVATHVVNVVVSVVLIVAYSLLTIGPGGHPNTGSVDWFANLDSAAPDAAVCNLGGARSATTGRCLVRPVDRTARRRHLRSALLLA